MIKGNKERRIKRYLPIDHCAEGCGYVEPKDGIEFWGIPYAWHTDNSTPFIEHRRGGVVIASVNCFDVSEIEFADEETQH